MDSYLITYMDVYEDTVRVGGVFYGSAQCYSRYRLAEQKDGTQKLVIYGTLPSPWNRDGAFNLEAELPEPGRCPGDRRRPDFKRRDRDQQAGRGPLPGEKSLYRRRLGGRTAGWALGTGPDWAAIKNQLQTSKEPYGWTFHFEDGVSNSAVFEEQMERYACVLLALTGNLGEVSWSYTVETESGPVKRERTVTEQECEKRLARRSSPSGRVLSGCRKWLNILGLERPGM